MDMSLTDAMKKRLKAIRGEKESDEETGRPPRKLRGHRESMIHDKAMKRVEENTNQEDD
jgi:hypothetical protein